MRSHYNQIEEIERKIMDLAKNEKFTIPEAAVMTKMSESWWRRAIWQKRVSVVRIGRKVFVTRATIDGLYTVVDAV